MMKGFHRVCLGMIVLAALTLCRPPFSLCAQGGEGGRLYVNARYGFSLTLPHGYESVMEPENGDGVIVSYKNGMVLRVYGTLSPSVMNRGCKATFENDQRYFDKVTYRRLNERESWFVLSGYRDGRIGYVKCFVGNTAAYAVDMSYPRTDASRHDGFVRAVVKSFKPGSLE